MHPLVTLLLVWASTPLAQTCHPECHWQCDDPVCPAHCAPVCQAPQCQRCFNVSGSLIDCTDVSPSCGVSCPVDQCEADSCPACELQCSPALCHGQPDTCLVLCEALQCGWVCQLPAHCPRPTCQLQCEQPACAYSQATGLRAPPLVLLTMMSVLTVLWIQ